MDTPACCIVKAILSSIDISLLAELTRVHVVIMTNALSTPTAKIDKNTVEFVCVKSIVPYTSIT